MLSFSLSLSPPNAQADIHVPTAPGTAVLEAGARSLDATAATVVVARGSGTHRFRSTVHLP